MSDLKMRVLIIVLVLSFPICEGFPSILKALLKALQTFEEGLKEVGKDVIHGNFSAALQDLRDTIQQGEEGLIIFPGTNWCGSGDIAKDYDDLGANVEADQCCREHDNCNDNIKGFGEKHGLTNKFSYTVSNCDCDRKFYKCNKEAKNIAASIVGFTYFNILKPKCFSFDYPIIKCIKFGKSHRKEDHCQEYQQDTSKPKVWQFMDAWDWFESD